MPWRAIPYDYVFRSSTTYTLSVLYYAYALWLMWRLIQPGVVYTGTRTDNLYWPARNIGRKHADEHAWNCLASHIRVIFTVRLWYYCSMSILVFHVMLHAVWARASASIQKANILCRHQNHDYDMAINLTIVIMSYTSVALGRSVVSFLAAICERHTGSRTHVW